MDVKLLKQRLNKYYGFLLLGILVFFAGSAILGKIAFGYGLGDVLYIFMLWGISILFLILFLIYRNQTLPLFATNVLFTVPVIWIVFMATIWRGSEHPWNGEIFYVPCRTEIQIDKNGSSETVVLSMCTMRYHSDFTGTWNGKEIENVEGEIKMPGKLRRHLDDPIEKILIQPAYTSHWESGVMTKKDRFKTDTLVVNKGYRLGGEICRIIDGKPVIEAIIR